MHRFILSDTPFEIDFASIKSQAGDLLDADKAPAIETTVAPVVEAPVAATPDAKVETKDASVAEPNVPDAAELDPDTQGDRLVKVKVDGQWEVKPLKDVVAGYSRTSHFTRQMQDLAQQKKEFAEKSGELTKLNEERVQIQNFLKNPQLVAQFLRQSNPELFAAAQQPITGADPNEIATVQQARDLVAQQALEFQQTLKSMESSMAAKLQGVTKEIEDRRETARHIETLNTTVKDIFEKNPILSSVRLAEDIIRYEVSKMNPTSIEEAQEAFRTVAQGMVEDLDKAYASNNKTKIAAAAKLSTPRIEPPGGSGPQIQPVDFKRQDGTLDWSKLKDAAMQMAG